MNISPEIDKSLIANSFSKAAHSYNDASFLQQEISLRILERLMYMKISPKVILDVGSGTGLLGDKLSSIYPNADIVNLDISLQMLERCNNVANIPCCADFDALPIKEHSVDLIVSNCSIQWSNNLNHTISQIKNCLRPTGVLMFTTFGPDSLKELRASWKKVDLFPHVHDFMDMHIIGDFLQKNNFTDPVVDKETITVTYQTAYKLLKDIKNMGASNLHPGRKKGLTIQTQLKKMIGHYHDDFSNKEGNLPASFEVIYGTAWGHSKPKNSPKEQYIPVDTIKKITY